MPDFDFDAYMNRKRSEAIPVGETPEDKELRVNRWENKVAQLRRASIQKGQDLLDYSAAKAVDEQKEREAFAKTWVSTSLENLSNPGELLGNPDPDSARGKAVNLAAQVATGAARHVGNAVAGVPALGAWTNERLITEEDRAAFNREQTGQATPEDLARLERRPAKEQSFDWLEGLADSARKAVFGDGPEPPTARELMTAAQKSRKQAIAVLGKTDISEIVDQGKRKEMAQDMAGFTDEWEGVKAGFKKMLAGDVIGGYKDYLKGVGGIASTAGKALTTNPEALLGYAAENAPQLAVGAAGPVGEVAMGALSAAQGQANYLRGLQNWQKQHPGEVYPPEALRREMAAWAGVGAASEQASDLASLGAMKVARDAAGDAVKTGFKQALLNTSKAAAKGFAAEAPTEGFQTFTEGEATLKPASAQDIFEGTVIGGGAGGLITGGVRGAAEALKATPEHAEQRAQAAKQAVDLAKAIEAGDTSAYLDPKAKTYDPTRAVQVLFGNSQREEATPEARQANLEQADDIIEGLAKREEKLKAQHSVSSPEALAGFKQALKIGQAALANADPADATTIAQLTEQVSDAQAGIRAIEKNQPEVKRIAANLKQVSQHLSEARAIREQLAQLVNPAATPEEVTAQVELADAPVNTAEPETVAKQQAVAEGIINLAMASPEHLTPEVATRLADNDKNAFTAPQRAYLRAFSAARIAENALKDDAQVAKEVFFGDEATGQVGIADYKKRIGQALAAGKQAPAERSLAGLRRFAQSHAEKLARATEAFGGMHEGASQIQIIKTDTGWSLADRHYSDRELRKNGGFSISSGSGAFVHAIEKESKALNQALAEMEAAYALRLGASPKATAPSPAQGETVAKATEQDSSTAHSVEVQAAPVDSNVQNSTVDSVDPIGKFNDDTPSGLGQTSEQEAISNNPEGHVDTLNKALKMTLKGASRTTKWGKTSDPVAEDILASKSLNALIEKLAKEGITSIHKVLGAGAGSIVLDTNLGALRLGSGPLSEIPQSETINQVIKSGTQGALRFELMPKADTTGITQADVDSVSETLLAEGLEFSDPGIDNLGRVGGKLVVIDAGAVRRRAQPNNKATDNAAQATEAAAQQQAEEPAENTPLPGTLKTFTHKSPEGTPFKERNLIADYFTQSEGAEGVASTRPLVAVKDFLSQVAGKAVAFKDFLKGTTLSVAQQGVLEAFAKQAGHWDSLIRANLIQGNKRRNDADFYYKDMMQFLIQATGSEGKTALDLEENVKTAMAYAAFSWVAENGGRSMYATPAETNAILQRDEDAPVSNEAYAALGLVGTREAVIVNALGQRALAALGLKATKDAPLDLLPRLESALGAHIMKLLMDDGIVERISISGEEMAALTKNAKTNTNAAFKFIRLVRENKALTAKAESIFQANKGTQGVLDKLFSVEPSQKEPSLTPIPFTQATTRNTRQRIPERLAKIVAEKQAEANYVRRDMWQLITQLSEDTALAIAGVDATPESLVHSARRVGLQAKNDGLVREYQSFMDYVNDVLMPLDGDLDNPFYLEYSVWKQQRVGIATRAINPQSSKIHRHLVYRKNWETEVRLDDDAQMQNFRLRVAEGLGVKADKQSNEKSLAEFEALAANPDIQAAVAVLQKALFEGGISAADQQVLVKAVKLGKGNFHSLDALVGLAHYEQALAAGQDSFTVQMMGEVDGVTNGPMLSHLLMGAGATVKDLFGLLNRGGFFEVGNKDAQYNLWRGAAQHLDLYENTTRHMEQAARALVQAKPALGAVMNAVWAITGELVKDDTVTKAGRNIIKTPLTAMVFGSSVNSAVDSMADNFIEAIYGQLEELAPDGDPTALIGHLNTLLGREKKIPAHTTVAQLMEASLSPREVKAIKQAFASTLGAAVASTMQQDFAAYIEARKSLNEAAQLTFELYNAAYEGLRAAKIAELIKAGALATNSKGVPIHDLTAEQEAAIRKQLAGMAPILHTAMSEKSGQLQAGLHISKSARKLSDRATFKGEVQFATPFGDNNAFSTGTHSYEVVESAPGVAMMPMAVHATDSDISHTTQAGREVLNVHDALGDGLKSLHETAQALNQNTWKTMLAYSPASEMYAALTRTLRGLQALQESGALSPEVLQRLADTLAQLAKKQKVEPEQLLATMVSRTKALAFVADDMKLQALENMASVDQYALEGGNYTVTDADRAEAAKKREALSSEVPAADLASADALTAALAGTRGHPGSAQVDPEMDGALADAEVLQVSPARAMQLLDHGHKDASLPERLRDHLAAVLDAMVLKKVALKQAVLDTLSRADAAVMVQLLSERFQRLAPNQWGEQGTPAIESDPELVALFEQRPNLTAAQTIAVLRNQLAKQGSARTRAFHAKLLKVLEKTVSPALTVRYVTPATATDQVLDKGADRARGWYVNKGGAEAIYVLSPDFVHSGLTAETLLHELVHGALAQTVQAELAAKKANPAYQSEALALVEELQALFEAAKAYATDNKLSHFGPALTDVQELIAWGMTNQDFQRDVLNKLQFKSKTSGNRLISGMQAFIRNLVGILFKGSAKSDRQIAESGLSVLIANVSGLFNEAARAAPSVDVVLNQQSPAPTAQIRHYTTLDLYIALGTAPVDASFDAHLRGLLSGIVQALHGPFGSFKALMQNQPLSAHDVLAKALDTGRAPFASLALVSGLKLTDQEAFVLEQVEATVAAAIAEDATTTRLAYKQLAKLYQESRQRLTAADFEALAPGQGQALYDFVFEVQAGRGNRADYLSRFAAMGLAHQGMNKLLQVPTKQAAVAKTDRTLGERLREVFEWILARFSDRMTHTYAGQQADEKLATLVDTLVQIEAKKQAGVMRRGDHLLDALESAVDKGAGALRNKMEKLSQAPVFENTDNAFVKLAGKAMHLVASDRVDLVLDGIAQVRDRAFKVTPGLFAGTFNYTRGALEQFQEVLRYTKNHERERKSLIANVSKHTLQSFDKANQKMGKAAKAALSAVFLRTDAQSLLGSYTLTQVAQFINQPATRGKEIARLEGQLLTNPRIRAFYVEQARALGYHLATGKSTTPDLLLNAGNIARMLGTTLEGRLTAAQVEEMTRVLDPLISLYALQYTSPATLKTAARVMAIEMARTQGNGIEMMLKLHASLLTDAKARLFEDNDTLMMKGYTPEIYDPNVDVVAATELQGEELEQLGYVKGKLLAHDPLDPAYDGPKHLYILRDGGARAHPTGIFSLTGEHTKGATRHSRRADPNTWSGQNNAKAVAATRAARAGHKPSVDFDPRAAAATFMVPVLNPAGEFVNYRHMMRDEVKDSLLDRDSRFDVLLGTLAGRTYDKQATKAHNRKAVQALKDLYDVDYAKRATSYTEVGPNSRDPQMREVYRLLPEDTRRAIQEIWGTPGMMVRFDLLDINFGYRKASLSSFADPGGYGPGKAEQLATHMVQDFLGVVARKRGMNARDTERFKKRVALRIRKGEAIWQEVVHEIKDIIVVKTGTVLLGNIWSNLTVLAIEGVPLSDIIRNHRVALRGALDYQRDHAEAQRLQSMLDSGYLAGADAAELTAQLKIVRDSLARNPVKPLIDAGLMPTIVEDVAAEDDIYSYKSRLTRKTERFAERVNPAVVNVAKYAYMAKDTPLYKVLSQTTQLSDFVARYTLHQHLTSRKRDPLTIAQANQRASETFVNYDIPMPRELQYLDDMFILPFTKYFLSIQRVIARLVKEHPGRVLSSLLAHSYVDLLPSVMDSSIAGRFGNNPLQAGALAYPTTLDDLATVQMGLSVFK